MLEDERITVSASPRRGALPRVAWSSASCRGVRSRWTAADSRLHRAEGAGGTECRPASLVHPSRDGRPARAGPSPGPRPDGPARSPAGSAAMLARPRSSRRHGCRRLEQAGAQLPLFEERAVRGHDGGGALDRRHHGRAPWCWRPVSCGWPGLIGPRKPRAQPGSAASAPSTTLAIPTWADSRRGIWRRNSVMPTPARSTGVA